MHITKQNRDQDMMRMRNVRKEKISHQLSYNKRNENKEENFGNE